MNSSSFIIGILFDVKVSEDFSSGSVAFISDISFISDNSFISDISFIC